VIPDTTNSIAKAPNNIPKIFSTTMIIVGPTILDRFAESHIANAAIIIIIKMGIKFIKISMELLSFDSAIRRAVVIAPGPAISGMAKGNIAID